MAKILKKSKENIENEIFKNQKSNTNSTASHKDE